MPDETIIPETQDDNQDNVLSGEEELFAAIKSLAESENDDDEDEDETFETHDEDEDESDDSTDELEDEVEEDETIEDEPKKVQSKEDNAKFAAQRRQAEIDKRVQAELEKFRTESPELQLANQLSEMYGRPATEIMAEMKEAALVKEAQEAKIPVEILRKQRDSDERADRLEQELNMMRYEGWKSKIRAEGETLKSSYTMLSDEDMTAAEDYILNVARNVDMPLEQAVYALHGKKIIDNLAKQKVQDNLANESGRKKKTPLAPNNGKASQAKSLTAEESYIAKQFGLSADDYLKYKSE